MKKSIALAAGLFLLVSAFAGADEKKADAKAPALNFKMKGLDGKDVDLSQYQGKVVLFVNVASQCGYTPQYKGLQELYAKHEKEGLVIVGVPCNQFGGQEPGNDKEIAQFCSSKYNVTFPMLSKVEVNGKNQCELYKFLTSKETNAKSSGPIKWNFTKFLISRNGEIVNRFETGVKPQDMEKAIETELKKK